MNSPILTVLVVEDFGLDRELYQCSLLADSSYAYRFLEVDSAIAGLELCQTQAIDAILLDYSLPDADGLQFLELLRIQSNGISPPVIMVADSNDATIAVQAIKMGAADYLVKSRLTPELLQLTMQNALKNSRCRLLQQQNDAQHNANQQIKTILVSMTDAYLTLDLDWRIVYTTKAATQLIRQISNLEPEEFLGKSYWDVFPWMVGQISERLYQRAMSQQLAVHFEVLYEPTGHWFEVDVYPCQTGLGIYFRDISAHKRTEIERNRLLAEALAAYVSAEAANRSRDEFIAIIAHELRSPLNSVLGWTRMLQTRELDAATTAKALSTIERNTLVQVQLIEDLLDIFRMVRGTLQLKKAPVNLVEAILTALDIVGPMAEAKQLNLRFSILNLQLGNGQEVGTQTLSFQSELDPCLIKNIKFQVSGDFNRLQQIMVNLLTNAIKFTPNFGQVEIELEPMDSLLQIRISDTGIGISPDFLPFIFERWKQGHKNSGSKDGLGLGLAIVKHLVELHAGTIVAESQGERQGAKFTVQLPLLETNGADILEEYLVVSEQK